MTEWKKNCNKNYVVSDALHFWRCFQDQLFQRTPVKIQTKNRANLKFCIIHTSSSNVSHSVGISKCPQWILALVSLSRVVIFLLFVLFYSIQMFCSFGACCFSQYLVYWKPWKFTQFHCIRKHCYTNRRWKSPIKHVPRK